MTQTTGVRTSGDRIERVGIVGAGIVGLATARAIQAAHPEAEVVLLEKEDEVGQHQTGHNSGVVHAGIYYTPGSLKARLCVEGGRLLREYCEEKGLEYDECGKLVVALDDEEATRLRGLHERALVNGVPDVALIEGDRIPEIEPHAVGKLALHSPHTAIVDFAAVAKELAKDVEAGGGKVHRSTRVLRIRHTSHGVDVLTDRGIASVGMLVNCGGLYADRIAELAGDSASPRIIPFRGEYHQLVPERRHLVRGLIYPVPDPRYPFLGVHLTKRVDGEVLIGPNAVMALAREGYRWPAIRASELLTSLRYPGVWHLARQHWRTGLDEVRRSFSAQRFAAEAQRYVPAIGPEDIVPAPAGVRAQALERDGSLVDDFRVSRTGNVVNVRNAPSPAATSSLAIGRLIAEQLSSDS